MAYNIGMNVVEVDGKGSPAIVGAAVSVAGFNITTARGVPNTPLRVTSFAQFVENFGSFFSMGLGPYMVKGFFDNGGQAAYINRIVDPDPVNGHSQGYILLNDSGANGTLRLESGFRGKDDPGKWGSDLWVKASQSSSVQSRILETTKATISGSPLTAPVDMSAFLSLFVAIDGDALPTEINFQASDFVNPGAATLGEIRDAVNRRTSRVIASLSEDDRLVLTSTGETGAMKNTWSSLQVTAANSDVGFAIMGSPSVGTPAPLLAGQTRLANVGDFVAGEAIEIGDGTNTAYGKILSINTLDNTVTWGPDIPSPGNFDLTLTIVKNREFSLAIALGKGHDDFIVEQWVNLSMESGLANYGPSVLNDSISGSKYVVAEDEDSPLGSGQNIPVAIDYTGFNPGRDGTPTAPHYTGDQAQHTGFYAFDSYDIQLLTCERTDPSIVSAALGYSSIRGDCIYIGSVPEGYTAAGQAGQYGKMFQGKKVYGAMYGPWIKILDPVGVGAAPFKYVNPAGHVMGVYARIESSRGIWKAPAGDEAVVFGALDIEHRLSDADHTDLVKNGSVNGIRAIGGAGIIVDASRTLSTDTRWLYVNVRLLFNYVKSSLKRGLRWVRQEPNKDSLWNLVKHNSVNPFLLGLWRQGAFGTGQPDEVFTVVCNASNNPPAQVDQGNFKCEVYFYPSKPAETIIIIVGQQPSGASAAEA